MAWLQTDPSGNFHISFRFAGRKYKRSRRTKNETEASARLHRLEENIRLVESGRLELPDSADAPIFLLSDGKMESKPKSRPNLKLRCLFDLYFNSIPEGSLEQSTIRGMKLHQRHLEREIGASFAIERLTRETLQTYVHKRSKAKGIRGRSLSPATIKKELVTFRSVWNWALAENVVSSPYPLKSVRFPKTDEKPHFRTFDEITRQIKRENLVEPEIADLWDCLFLKRDEIEQLLDHVKKNANHPFIYPMLVAAAHTGARRSELMRSQLIDFDTTHMVIREKKRVRGQRSARRVPLSDRLIESIDAWRKIHPGGSYTFCVPDLLRSKKSRQSASPLTRNEANDHFRRTLSDSKWEGCSRSGSSWFHRISR